MFAADCSALQFADATAGIYWRMSCGGADLDVLALEY
jgi:hypothetical protein